MSLTGTWSGQVPEQGVEGQFEERQAAFPGALPAAGLGSPDEPLLGLGALRPARVLSRMPCAPALRTIQID
jgi:hypothetical protein